MPGEIGEVNPSDLVGRLQSNIYSRPFISIVATGTGGTIRACVVTIRLIMCTAFGYILSCTGGSRSLIRIELDLVKPLQPN